MSNRIAEIRKRHKAAPRRVGIHARIPDPSIDFSQAHEDRGWLLDENKQLTKMCIRNAHQRDMALARLSRAARKIRELEAKHKRLRASLAKKRKKRKKT